MARKGWRKKIADAIAIHFYKWEFLRRNEEYRQSYRELWRVHGKLLRRIQYPNYYYQHDPLTFDARYVPDELFPDSHREIWWDIYGRNGLSQIVAEHCRKWEVSFMKDPGPLTGTQAQLAHLQESWSLTESASAAGKLGRGSHTLLNPFWGKVPPPAVVESHEIGSRPDSGAWLRLGLSLHHSKSEVLARVEQWYDESVGRNQKEDRTRLDRFPTYLRIWNLKSKLRSTHKVALALGEFQKLSKKKRDWGFYYQQSLLRGDDEAKAARTASRKSGLADGDDGVRAIYARIDYGFSEATRMISGGWRDLATPNPLIWL